MRRLMSVVFVAALLGLVLSSTAQPVAANRGHPQHEVPITFTFTTLQTGMDTAFTSPGAERCDPTAFWFSIFEGQGTATHLGDYTERNSHCMYVDMASATTMVGHFDHGLSTITAANGDTLTYAYGGTYVVDFVGLVSIIDIDWWEITGGSGRFADASGSGTGHLVQSLVDNAGTGSYAGTLAYDASARAGQ